MSRRIKLSNCRFRSKAGGRTGASDDGMVLIVLMMVAVLLLIALSASLPSVYQEGQREREKEAIFRGTQYGRAVALFHRQFGRYPTSVKELLQTNGIRFLRQAYADPLDPKGKWRFVHVNAAGALLDSKNQPLGGNRNNPNPAGLGSGNSFGGPGSSMQSGMGNSSTGNSFLSPSSPGGSGSMGFQSGMGGSGFGSSGEGSAESGATSSFFGNSNQIQGAFIAGVAPTSQKRSIIVWNKHDHYDEWEFLGIDMGIFGTQVGLPGGGGTPGGMQQFSNQPGGQGLFPSSPGSDSGAGGPP